MGSKEPRFEKYLHQIESFVVSDFSSSDDPWVNEYIQRDAIGSRARSMYESSDVLVISDVDEIPNPARLEEIVACEAVTFPLTLRSSFHYYYYEYVKPSYWFGVQVVNLGLIEGLR